MKLTIITINYNSSENTIKLLESLKNQTNNDFEVIVIDNASSEIDFENLNTYYNTYFTTTKGTFIDFRKIIFLKNSQNLGFSGGNNIGIKKALEIWGADPICNGANWMLLLNNDVWVENSFIERLRIKLGSKKGIVGLALDEGDRTVYAGKIEWLKPTLPHITMFNIVINNDVEHRYYVIGGAMLIHKDVFDKIGFLDESYFLYFEDADFCQRARKVGIPISFLSKIKIYHSVSASTKKLGSPTLLRYHYRNALCFNLKNGPFYVKLLIWPWSFFVTIKQILKISVGRNREQSKAILTGVIDFYRNNYGKLHV